MAKIVFSQDAPSGETVHFTFPEGEFDLGGKSKSYTSKDRALLNSASGHPWLDVEYDEAEEYAGSFVDTQVRPEDDPLSAVGPNAGIAFDPKEIKKIEDAKAEARGAGTHVAIDAGLDQDTKVSTGDVAETVAAADATDTKGSD